MKKAILLLVCLLAFEAEAQRVPEWLKEAAIYHIYPSSFKDSDGDGIGDLEGIRSKLDYIRSVGFDAIWISPVFRSEFRDGGYDITDFYAVDPRFGTNSGLVRLVEDAHARGMKVCLDLVAGHTSDRHPWFLQSQQADTEQHYSDYYIWTPSKELLPSKKFVRSDAPRGGNYLKNFFDCQPALNYGYAHPDPEKPWQQGYDDPGPTAVRRELRSIISFWMDKGVDGFRCDLASSLVKEDDADRSATMRLWGELRRWFEEKYPEGILLSEWSRPQQAVKAGFHIDLIIHNGVGNRIYRPLICSTKDNGEPTDCYFDPQGKGEVKSFVEAYAEEYAATRELGYASMPTSSHDIWRLNRNRRHTPAELKTVLTFFLTMPWVPIVYYGEEIGMRNQEEAPVKEGSFTSRNRSSCRTPMQWDTTRNAGFSTAAPEALYLPIDPSPRRPHVASQESDPHSILRYVRSLLALRRSVPALGTRGDWHYAGDVEKPYPMIYERSFDGERYLVLLNPSDRRITTDLPAPGRRFRRIAGTISEYMLSGGSFPELQYVVLDGRMRIHMQPASAIVLKVEE